MHCTPTVAGHNPNGEQGLVGTIPESLGQAPSLMMLALDSNSLTGSLPPQICQPLLIGLYLRNNQISGRLADLLDCIGLNFLDLSNTNVSGTLPDMDAWGFSGMSELYLSDNNITGTLPPAFYRLSRLVTVRLANNRYVGIMRSACQQAQCPCRCITKHTM